MSLLIIKNLIFILINCEIVIEFDNNFIANIKTNCFIIQILTIKLDIYYMILIVLNQEDTNFLISIK